MLQKKGLQYHLDICIKRS